MNEELIDLEKKLNIIFNENNKSISFFKDPVYTTFFEVSQSHEGTIWIYFKDSLKEDLNHIEIEQLWVYLFEIIEDVCIEYINSNDIEKVIFESHNLDKYNEYLILYDGVDKKLILEEY